MASQTVDLFVLYQIIKRLTTPFEESEAFKLGLIDKKGKRLKKASTPEEKKAMTYFDRFIFNLKRVMSKAGLNTKAGSYAAALFLLKESQTEEELTDQEILEGLLIEFNYLCENSNKTYKELFTETYKELYKEDAPAMSTGAAVAGTGDDPVHWKQKGRPRSRGKPIDALAYIKRMARQRSANTAIK